MLKSWNKKRIFYVALTAKLFNVVEMIAGPMSVTNLRLESQQDGQLVSWNYPADKDVSVTPKYDIRWCSKDISDCAHEKLDLQECDSESAENGTNDKNVLISNLKPWSTVVVEVSAVYQDETRSDIVKGPAAIKCFEIPVAGMSAYTRRAHN